ncbi:MAG: MoaD/ThiS family protein [bacterium]|nr:MoaD/ThiS family protein [bacterium]
MSVRLRLPANMRSLASDQSEIAIDGTTVGECLQNLAQQFPELESRLLDAEGNLQGFINVFVDNVSIRELRQLRTPVSEGSEVLIVAALAGG